MRRSGHSAFIRLLALLFLLWIGLDFGAHGIFATDAVPFAPLRDSSTIGAEASECGGCCSGDHCFCHSVSVGAVAPAQVAELAMLGASVTPLPTLVPQADRHPLDLPPRFVG